MYSQYIMAWTFELVLVAVRPPLLCFFHYNFMQILMNVHRTVMAVSRYVQTLMDLLNVHVKMGFVLPVMKGNVMVSELPERCRM